MRKVYMREGTTKGSAKTVSWPSQTEKKNKTENTVIIQVIPIDILVKSDRKEYKTKNNPAFQIVKIRQPYLS